MSDRPHFTAAQIIDALNATKGMSYLAAKHLGCSHETIMNYCKRYPSVMAAKEALRGQMVDVAELKLWQSVQKGEAWGITLCLKTLGKHRGYVERTELTGEEGGPIQLAVVRLPSKAPSLEVWTTEQDVTPYETNGHTVPAPLPLTPPEDDDLCQ
jgi:hypothetical protein